ncbi:MAG: ribonuclease III [Pyrinomonadaceae bacterium]
MSLTLGKLENLIGYKFENLELLERALTHRSFAYENILDGDEIRIRSLQNESLEFVGDSVLGLAIAEQLFVRNPDMSEGDLTLMKHYLVSTETLAKLAAKLKIGGFLRVGRGEEKTGGRHKQALLADALEAIIAAIFFDSGYLQAKAFVIRIFNNEFQTATPTTSIDYKTLFQETLQAAKMSAPVYSVVKTEGMPHERTFYVEANWTGGKVEGRGNSIKSAEMKAAQFALKALKEENNKT